MREVARLIVEAHSGRLAEADVPLADDLLYLIFGQCDARPAPRPPIHDDHSIGLDGAGSAVDLDRPCRSRTNRPRFSGWEWS